MISFSLVEEQNGVTISYHDKMKYIDGVSLDDASVYMCLRNVMKDMLEVAYTEGQKSIQEPIRKALGVQV